MKEESNFKPQLAYIEKKTAINLIRFAMANELVGLPVEDHPKNYRMNDDVWDAAALMSRVFWALWEHGKTHYKLSKEAVGEWKPGDVRAIEKPVIEGFELSGKYTGFGGTDIMEEAKKADGHMTNIYEVRLALPKDVAEEIRGLQEAEDRSFSWIFKRLLEMYTFDLVRKGPRPKNAVDPEDENKEEEIVVVL